MENYRSPKNIAALKLILKDYNSLLDEFSVIQIARGNDLKPLQKVSNDFLVRTRINTEALIPLLEIYKTSRPTIQPIGLLVRSILSDFLTFCYLVTFTHSDDANEETMQNELHLLERDFLNSMMEVINLESDMSEYRSDIPPVFENNEAYERHVVKLKQQFKHLFK